MKRNDCQTSEIYDAKEDARGGGGGGQGCIRGSEALLEKTSRQILRCYNSGNIIQGTPQNGENGVILYFF